MTTKAFARGRNLVVRILFPQASNHKPEGQAVGSLTPLELIEKYWGASHTETDDRDALTRLAAQIIHDIESDQE